MHCDQFVTVLLLSWISALCVCVCFIATSWSAHCVSLVYVNILHYQWSSQYHCIQLQLLFYLHQSDVLAPTQSLHTLLISYFAAFLFVLSLCMVWYGIVGFNVPIDTL